VRVVHGLAIHRDHRSSLDDAGTRVHSSRQAGIAVVGVQVFQHRPAGWWVRWAEFALGIGHVLKDTGQGLV